MNQLERALADMRFARKTHLDWAEHLEAHKDGECPQCSAKPYKLDAANEREWVAKYDRVIALLEGIEAAIQTGQTYLANNGWRDKHGPVYVDRMVDALLNRSDR